MLLFFPFVLLPLPISAGFSKHKTIYSLKIMAEFSTGQNASHTSVNMAVFKYVLKRPFRRSSFSSYLKGWFTFSSSMKYSQITWLGHKNSIALKGTTMEPFAAVLESSNNVGSALVCWELSEEQAQGQRKGSIWAIVGIRECHGASLPCDSGNQGSSFFLTCLHYFGPWVHLDELNLLFTNLFCDWGPCCSWLDAGMNWRGVVWDVCRFWVFCFQF